MKKAVLTLAMLAGLIVPASALTSDELQFVATPDGFYSLLGSMLYASETCGVPLPEKLLEALAANAGVTKKMTAEQGGPAIREATAMTKATAEKEGVETWCARQGAAMEKLREKGWYERTPQ